MCRVHDCREKRLDRKAFVLFGGLLNFSKAAMLSALIARPDYSDDLQTIIVDYAN